MPELLWQPSSRTCAQLGTLLLKKEMSQGAANVGGRRLHVGHGRRHVAGHGESHAALIAQGVLQGDGVGAAGITEALKCPEDPEHRASVPTVASVVLPPPKRKATEGMQYLRWLQ